MQDRFLRWLIDVREPDEYAVSHLPGAVNAQGRELVRLVREAGRARPIVLYCSVGYRSSRATEKLRRKGFDNVTNLEGSIFEWANTGKPLVRGGPESQTPTTRCIRLTMSGALFWTPNTAAMFHVPTRTYLKTRLLRHRHGARLFLVNCTPLTNRALL